MCGRFSLIQDPRVTLGQGMYVDALHAFGPRYNIAPTQDVVALLADSKGAWRLGELRWGLIPHWADDPAIGSRMINARSETAHQKPAFRKAFQRRRCLVFADGFYEWQRLPTRGKQPYRVTLSDERVFAFAGLWERWRPAAEGPADDPQTIFSCTILTTAPNEALRPIYDRMPVVLPEDDWRVWLDPERRRAEDLRSLLRPLPDEQVRAYPVSTLVNSPANDVPEVIQPA